jgi:hypothetical protein
MIEARPLVHAEKFELLELLYRRLPNGKRLKPSTKALCYLLADCSAALRWSNARIAETLGYSLRSVIRAMHELRSLGIISSVRKRREPSQKYIWMSKAREIGSNAVRLIKQKCAIAARFPVEAKKCHGRESSNHVCLEDLPIGAKSAIVGGPSPQLLRLMRRK